MAEFLNPFPGLTPDRRLTLRELSRAVRQALSAEEEAIHLYEAMADATDHPLAKKVLQDVADEEKVHAGEFLRLLSKLMPDEDAHNAEGSAEVDAMEKGADPGAGEPAAKAAPRATVGSLREGTGS